VKRFIVTLFGSFFYTGFFPFAPATLASFVWLTIYLFIPGGRFLSNPVALLIALPLALYLSGEMERVYGKDSSKIVIDEFVGMQVTFFAVDPSLSSGITGFICFRILDVLKPFPAGAAQRLRGGWGVVADDLVAGLYARVALLIIFRIVRLSW